MKAIILAGGLGTRLSEETDIKPKPMVEIGGKPIIWHIMKIYSTHGINDFIICCGYKGYLIKEYFQNYFLHQSDVTFHLQANSMEVQKNNTDPWKITLIDTGDNVMTGGRLKRVEKYVKDEEAFCLTYGDGLGDINISELIKFHKSHGKMVTISAVHPGARFGELEMKDQKVIAFQEKPQTGQGWINGGYFIIEPEFFELISDDSTVLEREPLEKAAEMGELMAYCHDGYWQCMDTKRDKDHLEELWLSGKAPWVLSE